MERRRCFTFLFALASLLINEVLSQRLRTTTRAPSEECALFKADDAATLHSGQSTFIEIGEIDVRDQFSLSMEVFPSTLNHNGILFSLGTRPNFEYYEWKTAAVNTQFIVLEFIFSALALTVKSLGTQHLHQIEIYKTYPTPYAIDDAQWHSVKVSRENSEWTIKIDNLEKKEAVNNRTDVQLFSKPAFIGGRPSYTDHQFQGAIRKLRINNRGVQLGGRRRSTDNVEVWHCREEEVSKFLTFLKQQKKYVRT